MNPAEPIFAGIKVRNKPVFLNLINISCTIQYTYVFIIFYKYCIMYGIPTYVFNLQRLFLTHRCLAVYQSKMLTEQEIEHILFNLVTCSLQ